MRVNDFSGGLNLKRSKAKLNTSEAVELINADISSGALTSFKGLGSATYSGVGPYVLQHLDDEIVSFTYNVWYFRYLNYLYYLDSLGTLYFNAASNITASELGIKIPDSPPEIIGKVNQPDPPELGILMSKPLDNLVNFLLGDSITWGSDTFSGDLPNGSYNYRLVFYNAEGTEPFHSEDHPSIAVSGASGAIGVWATAPGFLGLSVKLYREYLGSYHFVGDVLNWLILTFDSRAIDTVYDISGNPIETFTDTTKGLKPATTYDYALRSVDEPEAGHLLYSDPVLGSETTSAYVSTYYMARRLVNSDTAPAVPVGSLTRSVTVDNITKYYETTDATPSVPNSNYGDFVHDISGNDEPFFSSNLNGTYQYVYTHYLTSLGIESAPSSPSEEVVVIKGLVKLTIPEPVGIPYSATGTRIYRVGGTLKEFSLVAEVDLFIGTYIDSVSDSEIPGNLLVSETYANPPLNLTLLTEVNGVFLGAVESKLYFSIQGLIFAWPTLNFIEFGEDITCIEECVNGIIVCTETKTFIVTGNTPTNYSKTLVSGEHGCISTGSYRRLRNGVIYQSSTHLCFTTGGQVELLTKDKFNPLSVTINTSLVYNNTYYALSDTDVFILNLTDGNYYTLALAATDIKVIDGAVQVVVGTNLFKLFGGDYDLVLSYTSPVFTEDKHSEDKLYKEFYVAMDGEFTFEIFLDGVSVVTTSLSGRKLGNIKLPQATTRAMDLQVKVTGTGTLFEYEWKTDGRKNGR